MPLLQNNYGRDAVPGPPAEVVTVAASRHLYETTLRKQVLALDNVDIQTSALANGLQYDSESERVSGRASGTPGQFSGISAN